MQIAACSFKKTPDFQRYIAYRLREEYLYHIIIYYPLLVVPEPAAAKSIYRYCNTGCSDWNGYYSFIFKLCTFTRFEF